MPQLLDQFSGICATLVTLLPPIGEAMRRANAAWPNRLSIDQLLGDAGLAAIADDPLLLCVLQSTPVRDVSLERALTALRRSLLESSLAGKPIDDAALALCGALAQQCFINDYVFATTPDEEAQVERLKAGLDDALTAGAPVEPILPTALAMYLPLHGQSFAPALLAREWPGIVDAVLTQQLREPEEERRLRSAIARLTPIENDVSQRVRQQYEENPYPRWVHAATAPEAITIDDHMRRQFPTATYRPLDKSELDILVAGCGTGRHPFEVARTYRNARVLAVDLSLTSLCYAKRKTPPEVAGRIDYAQADILKIGSIAPDLRPDRCQRRAAPPCRSARRLAPIARAAAAERPHASRALQRDCPPRRGRRAYLHCRARLSGNRQRYPPMPRRPVEFAVEAIAKAGDFFSTSECRDLLFHVQERRMTIPEIKAFIAERQLNFIGFEFSPQALARYRALFAQAGWSLTDLDHWQALEKQYPDTFSSMYQFWVQKL